MTLDKENCSTTTDGSALKMGQDKISIRLELLDGSFMHNIGIASPTNTSVASNVGLASTWPLLEECFFFGC